MTELQQPKVSRGINLNNKSISGFIFLLDVSD